MSFDLLQRLTGNPLADSLALAVAIGSGWLIASVVQGDSVSSAALPSLVAGISSLVVSAFLTCISRRNSSRRGSR